MTAMMSITINTPATNGVASTNFDKKSAEVNYIAYVLDVVKVELLRGQGNTTSGTILGAAPNSASATSNTGGLGSTSLGTWTYTAVASNP